MPLVFFLVGAFALGSDQPGPTDSVESVRHYIASHWNAIHVHHTFIGLSFVAALWFVVLLFRVLHDAEGRPGTFSVLALSGAALAIAVELAVIAVHSATFIEASNTVQPPQHADGGGQRARRPGTVPLGHVLRGGGGRLDPRARPAGLARMERRGACSARSVGLYSGLAGVNASESSGPFGPALLLVYVPFLWFAAAGVALSLRARSSAVARD